MLKANGIAKAERAICPPTSFEFLPRLTLCGSHPDNCPSGVQRYTTSFVHFAAARRAAQYFFIRRLTARFWAADILRRLRVRLVVLLPAGRPRRVAVDEDRNENGDGTPSDFIALMIRA
jgi:hypothetical protein